jgi:PIN domain nuclease of toxin-antitoxin system
MILREPGGQRVDALLDDVEMGLPVQVAISFVNWCEILTRMQRENPATTGAQLSALLSGVELVPFGQVAAEHASDYALASRSLSFGDRACLALAKIKSATAWTADRHWTQCKLDVPIELIRL